VGFEVGSAVGSVVGFEVGSAMGFTVGSAVGIDVGSAVGFVVGADVGLEPSHHIPPHAFVHTFGLYEQDGMVACINQWFSSVHSELKYGE
jgi:hypothetical protein